jgi:Trypsin/PEP-CTERM motif
MKLSKIALATACVAGLTSFAGTALAQVTWAQESWSHNGWTAVQEIVGQTSTATIAGGGSPIYMAPKPQYSGAVGLLMNYGAAGSFVCSGSLIGAYSILTAAHCVSDGTSARPISTTAFFYAGADDPSVYAAGSPATQILVSSIAVNPAYSGEVVDQNDIAVLNLSAAAPGFAPIYGLSGLTDLTSVDHIIAGYGVRSDTGGSVGSNLGTGRLRYAGNRFDFRFGDADFEGYFNGAFGPQAVDHVWISDFDNGTAFRDGSCNVAIFEAPNAPAIFGKPVFTSDKYCNTGIGAFEGIGGGGDSGSGYFVDGQVAAVHSFALWQRDDESQNRFGQLKGAVPVYQHVDFIRASMVPEPATWAMIAAGFGIVGGVVRRRRATQAA